jgi:hypothetical protein
MVNNFNAAMLVSYSQLLKDSWLVRLVNARSHF